MITVAGVASLVIGVIIGYVGQRSRMCFVGGIRDYILVKDTFLLKGLIAFGLVAWVAFPIMGMGSSGTAGFGGLSGGGIMFFSTVIGGLGVGYFSVLANGCPFRQHVLASQGTVSSITYLMGFYAGAVIFHILVLPLVLRLLP
jgi:hypothetical protein